MSSKGVNRVTILGCLGQDPKITSLPTGTKIATINVATTDSWLDKTSREPMTHTEWHRIAFFDKLADIAEKFLRKGSRVYVEGSLHTRKWKDKEGIERYATEIRGSHFQMLDSKKESEEVSYKSSPSVYEKAKDEGLPFEDDDIPF